MTDRIPHMMSAQRRAPTMAAACSTRKSMPMRGFSFMARSIALAALFGALIALAPAKIVRADHSMCGLPIPNRPLQVSIDPWLQGAGLSYEDALSSLHQWNVLGQQVLGRDVFWEHFGEWWEADVLITAHGLSYTYVDTPCRTGYEQRGNNIAIVHLGLTNAAINRAWLVHEVGHALGLADHVVAGTDLTRYINAHVCNSYFGVMSACAARQNWLDPRLSDDAALLRNIWR